MTSARHPMARAGLALGLVLAAAGWPWGWSWGARSETSWSNGPGPTAPDPPDDSGPDRWRGSLTAMIRRLFRFALKLALTAGVGAVVSKVLARRRSAATDWSASSEPWPPIQPLAEDPPAPAPVAAPSGAEENGVTPTAASDEPRHWVEPDSEGGCPTSHPVKAKMGSGVFHLPGMANYERTNADRCYADADAAEADGLRPAKR